jgi:hypothetical protein
MAERGVHIAVTECECCAAPAESRGLPRARRTARVAGQGSPTGVRADQVTARLAPAVATLTTCERTCSLHITIANLAPHGPTSHRIQYESAE